MTSLRERLFEVVVIAYSDALNHIIAVFDQKLAMAACNALIQYLDLLGSDIHRGAYELHSHDLSQYMKLDSSAVKALTLMPDPTLPGVASVSGMQVTGSIVTGKAGKDSSASLFGLLNKCKTGQGTRLLAMWLKQPLVNLHQIGELACSA